MTLRRIKVGAEGAFGYLLDELGTQVACTAEHAYQDAPGAPWYTKVPAGANFLCVRGKHSLDGVHEFETFEITGVPGHTGLLFHPGNDEWDSNGCCLLGEQFGQLEDRKHPGLWEAVLNSRDAFQKFMALQNGAEFFRLTVEVA